MGTDCRCLFQNCKGETDNLAVCAMCKLEHYTPQQRSLPLPSPTHKWALHASEALEREEEQLPGQGGACTLQMLGPLARRGRLRRRP